MISGLLVIDQSFADQVCFGFVHNTLVNDSWEAWRRLSVPEYLLAMEIQHGAINPHGFPGCLYVCVVHSRSICADYTSAYVFGILGTSWDTSRSQAYALSWLIMSWKAF